MGSWHMKKFKIKMVNFCKAVQPFHPTFNCMDPDPCSENGSESTKLLDVDPIWIRIHKTEIL